LRYGGIVQSAEKFADLSQRRLAEQLEKVSAIRLVTEDRLSRVASRAKMADGIFKLYAQRPPLLPPSRTYCQCVLSLPACCSLSFGVVLNNKQ